MKEHKHAEVLRAIADGKEVEVYSDRMNSWIKPCICNPIQDSELLWRVKPEPKPDYIRFIGLPRLGIGHIEAYGVSSLKMVDHYPIVLTIFIDGETDKPKRVELINC